MVGGTILSPTLGLSFERSEAGASILATGAEWYYRASDADAWAVVRTVGIGSRFQIAHLNGVWFGPASDSYLPGLARSVDGETWFTQSNPSVLTSGYYRGFAYTNGTVIGQAYYDGVAGYTLDAGLTVQATAALPGFSGGYDVERPIVSQGGRTYMIGASGEIYVITAVAATASAQALPAPLGVPSCLAVRN
ncbi:hypothetical protein VZ95_04015 [Elstera litoralis]|uniref:Uncharacterized protein n=1 Tax=Elstera litoralis TaxID=552518 RepID=A0A0F3IVB3_9PROT|nr:hypothetical protein VZ95_04015 [Elstera litoralis]